MDEEDSDVEYEVQKIIGMKESKGTVLYHVRWRGYSPSWDTWEPYENLHSCANLIDRYLQEQHEASARLDTVTPSSDQQDQSRKKPSFFYVNSSDDEANAPKDSFWQDLECGKINVFSNDMYSNVKGQGRQSRPQSFQSMFGKRRRKDAPPNRTGAGKSKKFPAECHKVSQAAANSLEEGPMHDIDHRLTNVPEVVAPAGGSVTQTGVLWSDSDHLVDLTDTTQNSNDSADSMAQLGEVKESFEQVPDEKEKTDGEDVLVGHLTNNESTTSTVTTTTANTTAANSLRCRSDNTNPTLSAAVSASFTHSVSLTKSTMHTSPAATNQQPSSASTGQTKLTTANASVVTSNTSNVHRPETTTVCTNALHTDSSPVVHGTANESGNLENTRLLCSNPVTQSCSANVSTTVLDADVMKSSNTPPCISATETTCVLTDTSASQVVRHSQHLSEEGTHDLNSHTEQTSNTEVSDDTDVFDLNLNVWLPDVTNLTRSQQTFVSISAKFAEAVQNNDYSSVSKLLASDLESCDIHQVDKHGKTMVMVAAEHSYNDILELLVSHEADVNAVSHSHVTAAMMAAQQGFCCTVELLQLVGAHLNKQTLSQDTALLLAVRCGHPHIVRLLLDHGVNFSCPTTQHTALALASSLQEQAVTDIISKHVNKVKMEFEQQISASVAGAATTSPHPLFALQCLRLCESDVFTIIFEHQLTSTKPNSGMLLFVAHALIENGEVRCRLHGTSAVKLVSLNGTTLPPVTKEKNFVFTFGPLHNGLNKLLITTEKAPMSKIKLLVCAYKAHLL